MVKKKTKKNGSANGNGNGKRLNLQQAHFEAFPLCLSRLCGVSLVPSRVHHRDAKDAERSKEFTNLRCQFGTSSCCGTVTTKPLNKNELETKYDAQFKIVFDAIRQLMTPLPGPPKPPIGFHSRTKES